MQVSLCFGDQVTLCATYGSGPSGWKTRWNRRNEFADLLARKKLYTAAQGYLVDRLRAVLLRVKTRYAPNETHATAYGRESQATFWNCPGLMPVQRLNARAKLLWSEKPTMNAISACV